MQRTREIINCRSFVRIMGFIWDKGRIKSLEVHEADY